MTEKPKTILYMCRYAPVEVLAAMGARTEYLESEGGDLADAEVYMHPAICSYTKAAFEEIISRKDFDGVLFTSCCDSTRRHYDVLKRLYPEKFIHIMELPVFTGEDSVAFYKNSLDKLISEYGSFSGRRFDAEKLFGIMREENTIQDKEACGGKGISVVLAGAKIPPSLRRIAERAGFHIAFDMTCSGQETKSFDLPFAGADLFWEPDADELLDVYINGIFSKFPCKRMAEGDVRLRGLEEICAAAKADGLIYHTIKFCDNYSYEYASLLAGAAAPTTPILRLETDYTEGSAGQLKTRLEAFAEQLSGKKCKTLSEEKMKDGIYYAMGIDSGSTSTNVVIADSGHRIIASCTQPTGTIPGISAGDAAAKACETAGLSLSDISYTIATGYGRAAVNFSDESVTEITCHALGAHTLFPDARSVIDIGGQDSKVISIDENGKVENFAMNDKCAAGTGRYLEKTSSSLGVKLEDVGKAANSAGETLKISSMCTVFAESEVVSLIAEGKSVNSILRGLCFAIASRNKALFARASAKPPYVMTGGVAKNEGVVKALEEVLGEKVFIPAEPEIAGALGAAILAVKKITNPRSDE